MNSKADIGPYQRDIIEQLGCSPQDAAMEEDIMRRFVLHSTLDWLSREELNRGAKEAWDMLVADLDLFEQDCADRRRLSAELEACAAAQ
jgi:hypothetical protein